MSDKKLFEKALFAVDGRVGDLAEKCAVSRHTVTSWRKIAEGEKAGQLPRYARIRLTKVVDGIPIDPKHRDGQHGRQG